MNPLTVVLCQPGSFFSNCSAELASGAASHATRSLLVSLSPSTLSPSLPLGSSGRSRSGRHSGGEANSSGSQQRRGSGAGRSTIESLRLSAPPSPHSCRPHPCHPSRREVEGEWLRTKPGNHPFLRQTECKSNAEALQRRQISARFYMLPVLLSHPPMLSTLWSRSNTLGSPWRLCRLQSSSATKDPPSGPGLAAATWSRGEARRGRVEPCPRPGPLPLPLPPSRPLLAR